MDKVYTYDEMQKIYETNTSVLNTSQWVYLKLTDNPLICNIGTIVGDISGGNKYVSIRTTHNSAECERLLKNEFKKKYMCCYDSSDFFMGGYLDMDATFNGVVDVFNNILLKGENSGELTKPLSNTKSISDATKDKATSEISEKDGVYYCICKQGFKSLANCKRHQLYSCPDSGTHVSRPDSMKRKEKRENSHKYKKLESKS